MLLNPYNPLENIMKKSLFILFLFCLCVASPLFAGEQGFLEITKAEKKQDGKLMKAYQDGEVIPGVSVNEKTKIRVWDRIYAGDRVSVPKNVLVTFRSSNGNVVETKNHTIFIAGNITGEGESYIQNRGWMKYFVKKAVEFFTVSHEKYLAAVEGTVFEVNVDLEKKEIEFTAEEGEVSVTREFRVKVGDKDMEGLKEVVIISGRTGKRRSVRYDLSIEEAFEVFKNYEDVLAYFKKQLEKDEKEGEKLKIISAKNNIGLTSLELARYDEAVEIFESIAEEAIAFKNKEWIATSHNNLGGAWDSKGEYVPGQKFLYRY